MSDQLTFDGLLARAWEPGDRCPHGRTRHTHVSVAQMEICGLQIAGCRWVEVRPATKADPPGHTKQNGRYHVVDAMYWKQLVPPTEHDWPIDTYR